MTAFKKYKFPIPPLEIQQEIVKILDAFTELNTELNTEIKHRIKRAKKAIRILPKHAFRL
ncbi:hypothetical protein HpHA175_14840 [Helicobacter pylori]